MIIYIAGKMAGDEDYKYKFLKAEYKLRSRGHIVLNPATLPQGMPADKYMPICISMLQQADALCIIGDDWQDSRGVSLEKAFAEYQGKEITYMPSLELSI